jgi:hypothetical protein
VCGSFDFADPPVPVIKSFQNERTSSSGVLKIFKSKNLLFWVFENFGNR